MRVLVRERESEEAEMQDLDMAICDIYITYDILWPFVIYITYDIFVIYTLHMIFL